jgi:hypothetical protein
MKKTGSSFADQHLSMMQANKLALDAKGSEIDMALKIPSPEKDNIDLYANMQKSVGYEKRPNDIWRAALDGLFKGMGYGEKTKFTAEMKKKYDSYLRVGSWIYDWNEKAQGALEESNKKRAVAEKVSGFVNPIYSAVMGGGDRRQIDEMGRLSFRALQDEGVVPQGMVYSTVDPESMTAIYVKPDGSKGYLDLNSFVTEDARETAKDRVQSIGAQARTMSADASMMRAKDEHSMLDVTKDHKKAYIDQVNFNTDPKKWSERKGLESRANWNSTKIGEIAEQVQEADSFIHDQKKIREIIQTSTKLGKSPSAEIQRWWANKTGNNEDLDTIALHFGSGMVGMKDVYKGATSDTDVKEYKNTLTQADTNPDAALKRLNFVISYGENKAKVLRGRITAYEKDPTANLFTSDLTGNIAKKSEEEAGTTTTDKPTYIKMKNREGKPVAVLKDLATSKLGQGYEYIK